MDVEEELPSNGASFLQSPVKSLPSIVSHFLPALTSTTDSRFRLADGECYAHEEILSKYEHFSSLLKGQFAEAHVLSSEKKYVRESDAGETDSSNDTLPLIVEYDSDMEEDRLEPVEGGSTAGAMKLVDLPNFSYEGSS